MKMEIMSKKTITLIPGRLYEIKAMTKLKEIDEKKARRNRLYRFQKRVNRVAIFEHIQGYKEAFRVLDILYNFVSVREARRIKQ